MAENHEPAGCGCFGWLFAITALVLIVPAIFAGLYQLLPFLLIGFFIFRIYLRFKGVV